MECGAGASARVMLPGGKVFRNGQSTRADARATRNRTAAFVMKSQDGKESDMAKGNNRQQKNVKKPKQDKAAKGGKK